ncbi:hypothetical protein ACFFX0_31725 [Citricoccus parietis]|uniref:Uncharacterized protein n=1 Tax=Citricoccus parietis TaxID=592307 RepID=A0ABV5G9D4_9MICC
MMAARGSSLTRAAAMPAMVWGVALMGAPGVGGAWQGVPPGGRGVPASAPAVGLFPA